MKYGIAFAVVQLVAITMGARQQTNLCPGPLLVHIHGLQTYRLMAIYTGPVHGEQ